MGFKVLRKGTKKGFEGDLLLVEGCSIKIHLVEEDDNCALWVICWFVWRFMSMMVKHQTFCLDIQGPVVQNSLVNDSLNFQMAILQIHCYFFLKKCEN